MNIKLLPAWLILITMFACQSGNSGNKIKSGRIEYKITYLENHMERVQTPLLPKKMVVLINPKKSISTIDGFFGFLKISNIIDYKDDLAKTVVKVFDSEYLFVGEQGEPICCYDDMSGVEFEITDEYKNFDGLSGQKAIARMPDGEQFNIYFTKDISVRKPNKTNPYADIDGVLLDFRLTMSQLKMQFTAESIEEIDVDESEFDIYKDPKFINRESMTQVIDKLME